MLIPRASSLIFRRQYSHVFFLFGAVIILNGCINSGLADSTLELIEKSCIDECANKVNYKFNLIILFGGSLNQQIQDN